MKQVSEDLALTPSRQVTIYVVLTGALNTAGQPSCRMEKMEKPICRMDQATNATARPGVSLKAVLREGGSILETTTATKINALTLTSMNTKQFNATDFMIVRETTTTTIYSYLCLATILTSTQERWTTTFLSLATLVPS